MVMRVWGTREGRRDVRGAAVTTEATGAMGVQGRSGLYGYPRLWPVMAMEKVTDAPIMRRWFKQA